MKTPEQLLEGFEIKYDGFDMTKSVAMIMRYYAKEVSNKSLSKAAQRLHIASIDQELAPEQVTEVITSTPIVTP